MAVCQLKIVVTDPPLSRASSAPTGFLLSPDLWLNTNPCRRELARDGGGSGSWVPADRPLSRASSAPTGFLVGIGICVLAPIPVGVSLLAMAVGQVVVCRLTDRYREQAQLPQVFWLASGFGVWHQSL